MISKISSEKIEKEHLGEAQFLSSFADVESMPQECSDVCFIGRSNSGKSTLLSALMKNSSLVKISKQPGSTRTVNFFQKNNLYLVDLPGYGYAKTNFANRDALSKIINDYLTKRENIKTAFLLLDCNRDIKETEEYVVSIMKKRKIPLILILTKIDRLNQREMVKLKNKIKEFYSEMFFLTFAISGRDRKNISELVNYIKSLGG
ncbi:MAG: ribosome biogenesis GTP-binding protein YihA/YsxC [Spirochaetia bacterium]|nr:ribosome biogenesis GTP-binding protein YihA/YsxC [Spirochaetia bacterium]